MDFEDFIAITPLALVQLVLIISVETIGLVEFSKNYHKLRKGKLATLTFAVTFICSSMQSHFVSPVTSRIFNLVFLSLAVLQCAYQVVVQAIPRAIQGFIDKVIGSSKIDA